MNSSRTILLFLCIVICINFRLNAQHDATNPGISVLWKSGAISGSVEIVNGQQGILRLKKGKGQINGNNFKFRSTQNNCLSLTLLNPAVGAGSAATIVTIHSGKRSFSFFLRDVSSEYPIYIPEYETIVTRDDDARNYDQIEAAVREGKRQTSLEKINSEPEESFDSAAIHTRNQSCPTWLGISRDIRIFEIGLPQDMDLITPRNASSPVKIPETGESTVTYGWLAGRGQSVEYNRKRRLEDGCLPILNSVQNDGGIEYSTTQFVTLEQTPLNGPLPAGTDFMVADNSSYGHMFTVPQELELKKRIEAESIKNEETVLYLRVKARNTTQAPKYTWFRTVRPGASWWEKLKYTFDPHSGFSSYSSDRVFGISKLNGEALPDEEIAVLLRPGEEAEFEFMLPHEPVSALRAAKLSGCSFDEKLEECRSFWKNKLRQATSVSLPEKRIEEMMRAGLLHLDLITYGKEPFGTLAPSVGVYSPIGTESSPIMQFYMSMGLFDEAKRCLMYFLDKQHEDGMIQNFGGYMVETGAALWSMGEYFRYTGDTAWIRQVEPKLVKACDFLFQWRDKNKKEELRGKGYGMIDGKVADPEDQFHQFMLNGYAYLGVSRAGEMLAAVDPKTSARISAEASAWKKDIRSSFFNSLAGSPVVPIGDGSWCPTAPPWTEEKAMRLLYLNPETFLSHGTFTVSDAMLGPLYLVFCEVLDPEEEESALLLKYHSDMFYERNAAFSQPYYSRHNWLQIKLGMVKPFLKTYYNTFSALADRETYTFWEHLYKVSVHKTHEEAWFLMETRWMLYLEDGKTLRLLPGVPRKWLEDGKIISVENAASYFGPISFSVKSDLKHSTIAANISCSSERKPAEVRFRIPNPEGKQPVKVTGGTWDVQSESVIVKPFSGRAEVRLEY
jgi:hypothetical protein